MTKGEAIHNYFSGFNLPAYEANSVQSGTELPYLTYTMVSGAIGTPVSCAVNIWYRTEYNAVPNAKADEICKAVKISKPIRYDDGLIWLTLDNPDWQAIPVEDEPSRKGRLINVTMEYLSNY
jgi:hypothetical protein